MICAIAALLLVAYQGARVEHPMPLGQVAEVRNDALRRVEEGKRRGNQWWPQIVSLEIAQRFWTASDDELVKLAETDPVETLREISYRPRKSMLAVYRALLKKPQTDRFTFIVLLDLSWRKGWLPAETDAFYAEALSNPNREARSVAAVLLGNRLPARTAPILRTILREDGRRGAILAAARALESCIGAKAIPDLEQAANRVEKFPQVPRDYLRSYFYHELMLMRFRLGDPKMLPVARGYALQRSDPHLAQDAIEGLAARYGLREKATLRKALYSGGAQRDLARRWLFHLGDRGAAKDMREAAKTEPYDVLNAAWFKGIGAALKDTADRLHLGERGERPAAVRRPQSHASVLDRWGDR